MENNQPTIVQRNGNAITRWFTKKAIYLKNHLHAIPLFVTVLSTIIITATIFIFNDAINVMPYHNINGFLFFVTVLASIMGSVSYLMATGKHVTKKKKILMLCLYYILMITQIVLDILYRIDVAREIGIDPTLARPDRWFIPLSSVWALVHIIIICFAIVLSIIAPLLQPITRKIQLGEGARREKARKAEIAAQTKSSEQTKLEDSIEKPE